MHWFLPPKQTFLRRNMSWRLLVVRIWRRRWSFVLMDLLMDPIRHRRLLTDFWHHHLVDLPTKRQSNRLKQIKQGRVNLYAAKAENIDLGRSRCRDGSYDTEIGKKKGRIMACDPPQRLLFFPSWLPLSSLARSLALFSFKLKRKPENRGETKAGGLYLVPQRQSGGRESIASNPTAVRD